MQKERSETLTLQQILDEWLQLRIEAIQSMLWVLDSSDKYGGKVPIQVQIGNGPTIHSTMPFISNPILAAGYVHARAILEFIGISAKNGKLMQIRGRRETDVAIEHYSIDGVYLQKVTLDEVYSAINMPKTIAEWALVAIIESANKFYAHVTKGEVLVMAMDHQVRVALDGILVLLHNHLFVKMKNQEPIVVEKGSTYSSNSCNQNCPSKTTLQA